MYFDMDEDDLDHPDLFQVISRELFAVTTNYLNSNSDLGTIPTHTEDGIPIRKIYVSNLPPKTTRTELFGLFAQYGFIKSCWLRLGDKGPNKSPAPTYAFITFSNPADAHKALKAPFHEKQLRGRNLRISPADSWHQPAEESDVRIPRRPRISINQRFHEMQVMPSVYEGFREPRAYQSVYGTDPRRTRSHIPPLNRFNTQDDYKHLIHDMHYITPRSYNILDVLNVDCMNHIFSYISVKDLIMGERASKRWQLLIHEYLQGVRIFKTTWWRSSSVTLTTAILRKLLQRVGSSLIRLHLDHTWSALNDRTAHTIGKFCPNLEELKVIGMHTKNWNPLTYGCKNLKKISFVSCNKLTDSSLIQIVKSETSVENIIIANNTHVTGLFLAAASNRKLNSLSFYNCYSLQGAVLCTAIDTLPRITTLRLDVCPLAIWKIVPIILKKLPKLYELSLTEYTSIEMRFDTYEVEEFCEALSILKDLVVLNFSQNVYVNNSVVKQVARTCSKLEVLNLSSCNSAKNMIPGAFPKKGVCDDAILAICRNCPKITHLDISYLSSITDEGMAQVCRLENLQIVTARGNSALSTQPFIKCLASCPNLQEIDVCGCDAVSEELVAATIRAIEARPRLMLLMVAGTAASALDDLPHHHMLSINMEDDFCNPHNRPDYLNHVFDDSSDDSFDGLFDNDDLDWIHPVVLDHDDDDDDDLFDDEFDNIGAFYGMGVQQDVVRL